MLEGLDQIDWASLTHAYGPASDVPDQIRGLASADEKTREASLYELFGNIWHQGTVYDASSHAVPFLVELVGDPSVQGKVGILTLLTALATGSSYLDVHARGPDEISRRMREKPAFEESLSRELSWVRATQLAVEVGLATYLKLLLSPDWETRLNAARVLATCVDHRETAATALLECFERETDPRVHFGLLLCLGDVGVENDVRFLTAIVGTEPESPESGLETEEPPSPGFLRWAAAMALTKLQHDETPTSAVRILEEVLLDPEPVDEFLNEMPWDHHDAVEASCSALAYLTPARSIPILARALAAVSEPGLTSVMWHLLNAAFPDRPYLGPVMPPRAAGSLELLERQALAALAARDEVWKPSWDIASALRRLGLPGKRNDLRDLLKIDFQQEAKK
jgi:HEAT repeats